MCKFLTGSGDAAIPLTEQAIHLGPRDRDLNWRYSWLGFIHLMQSRTDEAIVWLEKARSADPLGWSARYFLASAYGVKGELDRAAAELAEARRLRSPTDRYSTIARVRANGDQRCRQCVPNLKRFFWPACARRGAGRGMNRGFVLKAPGWRSGQGSNPESAWLHRKVGFRPRSRRPVQRITGGG